MIRTKGAHVDYRARNCAFDSSEYLSIDVESYTFNDEGWTRSRPTTIKRAAFLVRCRV